KFWGVSLSTHNVLSYAKRIDDICLGEWWQSKRWLRVSRILVAIHLMRNYLLQLEDKDISLNHT
ncbi:hypothetical protein, partial [Acinetobacter sp. SA01]|uniref:hypothetical protein n=1 Tax=Acinetobacter sp. SA01 TaxID=1862567 RepID=UPI00196B68B5